MKKRITILISIAIMTVLTACTFYSNKSEENTLNYSSKEDKSEGNTLNYSSKEDVIIESTSNFNYSKDKIIENQISPEISAIYTPVLQSWKQAIQENFGYSIETQNVKTYPYIKQSLPTDFGHAHYAYYDIDENGIPELCIGAFYNFDYYFLADVFTINENQPVRLFEGVEDRGFWPRNNLNFSKDGKSLIVQGSGGAAYTTIDFYRILRNGYQVELIEGVATFNPEDSSDITPHYRLSDGSYMKMADIDIIKDKYYDKTYSGVNKNLIYSSNFYKQLEWIPIAR